MPVFGHSVRSSTQLSEERDGHNEKIIKEYVLTNSCIVEN